MKILARLAVVAFTFLLFASMARALNKSPAEKSQSRIEDLFVWKVSDALDLSPDVETKFSLEFKRLSQKKTDLWDGIEKVVTEIGQTKDPKKLDALLKEYKSRVGAYGHIPLEETETFEKLFGKQKFAQYLVVKRDLTDRLKDFVTGPSSSEPKKLQDPKVIQDSN